MAVVTILLGGFLSYQLYQLSNKTIDSFDKTLSNVDTAHRVWDSFRNAKEYAGSIQLMIQPQESTFVAEEFAKHYESLALGLKHLKDNSLSVDIVDIVDNSSDLVVQWREEQLKVITGIGLEGIPINSQLRSLEGKVEKILESVVSRTIQGAKQRQIEAKNTVNGSIVVAVGMVIAAGLLALAFALFISASLTNPIRQLYIFMNDLAEGRGNLTKRMEQNDQDELGMMAGKFNQFLGTLQQMVGKTMGAAKMLEEATENFQQKTNDTSQNIEQQKDVIARTTQTVTELRSFTKSIVAEAHTARNMAQEVSDGATNSERIVLQSMNSIETLSSSIMTTSDHINKLAENSDKVSLVVAVIKGIAEQTNLLALNAAIEAARAGESGRGFAVVADEVRTLAVKTQESTSDIQKIIESIQQGVAISEKTMKISNEQAQLCVAENAGVRNALSEMSSSVIEINKMNLRILSATEQQQKSTAEVDTDMQQVQDMTEQSYTNMSDMRHESLELENTAKSLTQTVQGFVI